MTNDRHMSTEEFAAKLRMLGLTKEAAVTELGVSRSALYRYARGEVPIPASVAKLIDAMLQRRHLTMRQV